MYSLLILNRRVKQQEKKKTPKEVIWCINLTFIVRYILTDKTYVVNGTYWIIIINDYAIFFTNRSWLYLMSIELIIRFRWWWYIGYVKNTFVQHLKLFAQKKTKNKNINRKLNYWCVLNVSYARWTQFAWPQIVWDILRHGNSICFACFMAKT